LLALFFAFVLAAGAESPVQSPAYVEVPFHGQPSIATNGSGFLTAWNEAGRVYASRLDPAGALADTTRIAIGPVPSTERPVVASDGSDYAIAFANPQGLYAARVTRAGEVTQLRIVGPGGSRGLALVSDGASYLLTYEAAGHSLRGLLLDREVKPMREILLADFFDTGSRAVAASDRRAFIVAWQSAAGQIRVRVLDGNARPTGVEFTLSGVEPELSWDGFRYLLIRREVSLGISVISDDGYVRELGTIADAGAARNAAIGSNGSAAIVVWRDAAQNAGIAVAIDGAGSEIRRDTVSATATLPWNAAVAGNGTHIIALTPDSATDHVTDAAAEPVRITIERRAVGQSSPAGTTLDNQQLIVWREPGGPDGQSTSIRGQLSSAGGPATALIIREGVPVGVPRVAMGNFRNFLVVWTELSPPPGYIMAKRISSEGEVVDALPIIITFARPLSDPVVVSNGADFVVFSSLDEQQNGRGTIGASRVSGLGRVDPSPIPLSDSADAVEPAAAFDGSRTLVVWRERDTHRIAGRFFGSNGSLGPVLTIASGFDDRLPRIAASGNGFLAVWSRTGDGLYCAAVHVDGTVGDVLPLDTAHSIVETDVAWNGERYAIVWTDRFGVPTPAAYGRLVTPDGRIEGTSSRLFVADGPVGQPALFAARGGLVSLAYTRRANEALYGGADRIFTRPLFLEPRTRRRPAE